MSIWFHTKIRYKMILLQIHCTVFLIFQVILRLAVWFSPVFNLIGCVTCTFDNCVGCNVGWSLTQMQNEVLFEWEICSFERAAIKRPGQKQTIQWPNKVFGHLSHIQCIKYHALYNKASTQVAFTSMKDSTSTLHKHIFTSLQFNFKSMDRFQVSWELNASDF